MKAIEAELRSIRADGSVTLLDPDSRPDPTSISLTVERSTRSASSSSASQKRSVECFPIAAVNPGDTHLAPAQTRAGIQHPLEGNRATHRKTHTVTARPNPQQARQMLAEKAHQINLLSSQQESVILELITLSEQLESANAVCETAEVPHVDADAAGTLVLTSRSIELPEPEIRTRRRPRRSHLMFASTGAIWQGTWVWLSGLGRVGSFVLAPLGLDKKPSRTGRTDRRPSRRASGRRTAEIFTFQEAAILVLGSALLRVGLDLLVISYPVLWLPSLLVMLTPAAIAIYRSTLAPQAGLVWGYRLFSLMIGLLLGGRL
jgi:hypothetical protein